MPYPKRYTKDLTHLTTIRLSRDMRDQAERRADYLGISFSDFVRQSINRNIFVSGGIEDEVAKRTLAITLGKER